MINLDNNEFDNFLKIKKIKKIRNKALNFCKNKASTMRFSSAKAKKEWIINCMGRFDKCLNKTKAMRFSSAEGMKTWLNDCWNRNYFDNFNLQVTDGWCNNDSCEIDENLTEKEKICLKKLAMRKEERGDEEFDEKAFMDKCVNLTIDDTPPVETETETKEPPAPINESKPESINTNGKKLLLFAAIGIAALIVVFKK